MNGVQTVVAAGGVGLVVANMWTGTQRQQVAQMFGGGSAPSAHTALVQLAGEMLFVVVATILAGVSDVWGALMAVVIVGLWLLWAMNHYGAKTTPVMGGGQ
jgi:hypothetical protein